MIIEEDQYLAHYGILRRSGRYPWGSGDNVPQRSKTFLDYVEDAKSKGLSESEIARGFGIGKEVNGVFYPSTTDLRALKSIAKNEIKQENRRTVARLVDKGMSNVAIGKQMGIPESTVRLLRAPIDQEKADILKTTADILRDQVNEHEVVDIGIGQEHNYLGVSKERLNTAVAILKEEGFQVHSVKLPQLGTTHNTEYKVLVKPGITQKEIWQDPTRIKFPNSFSQDNGRTFNKTQPPLSIHPDRVDVKYKENGGGEADGVIYVRPGVKDVSLGGTPYAQVRIKVGNGHYLKGMAIYKDDLPEGIDLQFNTNKSDTGNKLDAMKPLTKSKDFPFGGSVVRQIFDEPGNPKAKVTSAMNIMGTREGSGEEGSWSTWKKTLSTQFLSKQSPALAKAQLDMTYERRQKEFDVINNLTNPTVKKKLLQSFSDETDKAANHLDSAKLPRTGWHVILPVNTLKPNEIYAPRFRNGEQVVLVRYPHGGTFEIPELTVNNQHPDAKKLLGDTKDAVGIHHSVAQHLSGADFDGDTVLVIPNNNRKVKTTSPLERLRDFDPLSYKNAPGVEFSGNTQHLMGDISNLITDMTIKGAPHSKISQAVRHSMVVIDAEKKNLNYKASANDHGIANLKEEYQGRKRGGASTLISLATSETRVLDRKDRLAKDGGAIDPVTGKRMFVPTGRLKRDGSPLKIKSTKLAETDDAHSLSSGTPIEKVYAEHSNKLKALANQARVEMVKTPRLQMSPSAKKTYAKEVSSLKAKLTVAQKNAPSERQAQIIGAASYKAIKASDPSLTPEQLKKIKYQQLQEARTRVGAKKEQIDITPKEWNAIQAGAISDNQLEEILRNTDIEKVRKFATPRREVLMTPTNTSRAKQMLASGYTRAQVADQLGVSLSTLDNATTE